MRRHTSALFAPLLAAFLSACEPVTGPTPGELFVTSDPPNLLLTNQGDRPVFYFAITQELAQRANWEPCTDPDTCDRLDRHSTAQISIDSVTGDPTEGDAVLVYWWHLIPASEGGFEPDTVRVSGVEL